MISGWLSPPLRVVGPLLASGLLATCAVSCQATKDEVAEPRSRVPPVEVRAAVDPAVATTGDVITFTVEVERDPESSVSVPEPGTEIAGFRITDASQERKEAAGGRVIERNLYRLRADLVGSYILPPVEVQFTDADGGQGTVSTSEIFVEVQSVLPAEGEASDIREIKPLEVVERPLPWPWILGLGALVLAVAAALWARSRGRGAELEQRVRPAHEIALEELSRLRRTDFSDLEALRAYYFDISEVLRRYVEARFGLNATDLTTEEIVPRLGELDVSPEECSSLRAFLVDTDRVKFARHLPESEEIESTWEHALGFVEATVPRVPEGEEDDPRNERGQPEPMEPVGGMG